MTDSQDQHPNVSISDSFGFVLGNNAHVEQHIHYMGTSSYGVMPLPLVSTSGTITFPYRGLSPFGGQDEQLFFGRESAVTKVLELMSRRLAGTGLLVVSGVSGAGKSSLLQAGVLPQLRRAGLGSAPEAASWPCLVFTPGERPLEELAIRVAPRAAVDAATLLPRLAAEPKGFAMTARQAALADSGNPEEDGGGLPHEVGQRRMLLVIDQFEQLFTRCKSEDERQVFITALHAAAARAAGERRAPAALVVILVRADFEARLADYPLLVPAVQDRYLLTAMTPRQLRAIITEPALKAGSSVNKNLVQALLEEMRTRTVSSAADSGTSAIGAGALPLLSHALDQAWRHRTGKVLTLADYERTGGIEGAVADSAQCAYDRLTPAQQAVARQVFIRLTATSSDGIDTADRVTRTELTDGKSAAEAGDVEAVLEAFAAERLLTLAADSVEISHEVLLTAWPLLRDTWLGETHADRIIRTQLRRTATEWTRNSRDPSYLYRGTVLQTAVETADRIGADSARNPPLSQIERDFLLDSKSARRRTARWRKAAIAAPLALAVTASAAAGFALHNEANATRQHAIALSRQLAADGLTIDLTDPVTARQLAVAAWRVHPTDQAQSAMTTLLAEQRQDGMLPATSEENGLKDPVAFSPDGKLLATAGSDGEVRLWNPATGQLVRAPLAAVTGSDAAVFAVAFSPDGKLLATAGSDGTVRLWNPATGQLVRAPLPAVTGSDAAVFAVAFSPDGKLLATADSDGTVRLWNPATGRAVGAPLPAMTGSGAVYGVAFSPDGKLLATADSDGTVRLWNPATGRAVGAPLPAMTGSGAVYGVAFSPDGKLLATADSDGTVRLWNPATGQPSGTPLSASPRGPVFGVAFSPDGKLLAGADSNGTVLLWNPATGQPSGRPLPAVAGNNGVVLGVVFSPDGKLLATAGSDGTVRLWNPATGQPSGTPPSAITGASDVYGVAFSPDGKLLATADSDGTVRLWNPATGQPLGAPLPSDSTAVVGVAFSPDGKLLASADGDGTVRLWNPATGRAAGAPLPANTGRYAIVNGLAFSPDGKLLATGDGDGTVQLWNPATGQPVRAPLPAVADFDISNVYGVTFSPDGKLLASTNGDGTVRLWDPATGREIGAALSTDSTAVYGVAFSPDGKLLASADGDGTVRLWDTATGQEVGTPLPAVTGSGAVYGVAFSPDGKLLASADSDGKVRLWDTATDQPIGVLSASPTDPVNGVAFSPDGKLLASADGDGNVRLWDVWLLANPYTTLCAEVGLPTLQDWDEYAVGEPLPKTCA